MTLGSGSVELTHEALLEAWGREDRDPALLYRGSRLAAAIK